MTDMMNFGIPISAIENSIRDDVSKSWGPLFKSFRSMDRARTGTVSPRQFQKGLSKHKIRLSANQIFSLSKKYSKKNKGGDRVQYAPFMKYCVMTSPRSKMNAFSPRARSARRAHARDPSPPASVESLAQGDPIAVGAGARGRGRAVETKIEGQVLQNWRLMRKTFRKQ